MYDIKHLEAGQHQPESLPHHLDLDQPYQHQHLAIGVGQLNERLSQSTQQLTCSVITPPKSRIEQQQTFPFPPVSPIEATHMTLLKLRHRRAFQRRACLLSILAAFVFGMALGVVVPMFGLPDYFGSSSSGSDVSSPIVSKLNLSLDAEREHPPSNFPSIYELPPYSVAFIKDSNVELSAEQVFRNAFHLEQDRNAPDSMIVKKLDTNDGSIKEFHVQRTSNGLYRKGPERRLSKSMSTETVKKPSINEALNDAQSQVEGLIESDIYWGEQVERALPKGFASQDQQSWEKYVANQGQVVRLEHGCGRMQNRLVVFADGTRACARYRQNTDQIQGEIFSYYLGQLLNISNLAPSAATVIDTTTNGWSSALGDITQAQWKERRPVVLTRWLADLEPAGIPQPFQPLERHLNRYDVWNLTRNMQREGQTANHQSSMLEETQSESKSESESESALLLQRLIELAQWSDLIVFDYLIANLDRVVNNLYNFQWNADIMAAPAHNLARQTHSQLLVFLDNESGLLHGYRLLKKYEAYHSLLLDNLCLFRRPTIEALRRLRAEGAGRQLRQMFESTTSGQVRDVLPSLPDKSIKILVERIDRVLGQVQKCRDSSSSSSRTSNNSKGSS
ncbi:extracellular serine/threonine protein kinase four-jointed [Drosophila willistoni]|uniref:extracellular serine/threonine protein kinase four-jointed n=1 Tax=Drosophila willistoni TaxID=7260 RepID=UPI000C26CF0B|nr:extracellular serine/threonine protein kinase four-jointed [Drosophila willistoni]